MKPDEALREASQAGRFNQFEISSHARQRMNERNVTRRDICCALQSASDAVMQSAPEERWRLNGGRDDDGDALDVVIVLSGRRLIVTLF